MELTTRALQPEEHGRWNDFVASSPHGHIYQSYEWGMFRALEGWRSHWIVLEDGPRLEGAALMLEKRVRGLGRSIFLVPRGPVVDYGDQEKVAVLWSGLEKTARANRGVFLRISPEILAADPRPPVFSSLRPGRGELLHRCTFRVGLEGDLGQILARMESRTRHAIAKAERRGVEVKDGCGTEEIRAFHGLLSETAARQGFRVQDRSFFENVVGVLAPASRVRVFLAFYEGRPVSGAVVLLFGRKAWYTWGGSSAAGRGANPNEFLHWGIIQWLKARGFAYYDLHGVGCDVKPGDRTWGVYLFKRGFGGERVEWAGEWDRVFSPLGYRAWQLVWGPYLHLGGWLAKRTGTLRRQGRRGGWRADHR